MDDDTCSAEGCVRSPAPKKRSGPRSPYCSRQCRNRTSYLKFKASERPKVSKRDLTPKRCPECDCAFIPAKSAKQKFCSAPCAKRMQNRKYVANRPLCTAKDCALRSVSGGLCRKHHPKGSTWSRGRVETRRSNLRRKTQQRRARSKGDAGAPLIDRDDIGDRDGWRCGICARKVDRRLSYPDPRSASLDHIEPLSLGGLHELTNVQISHLRCNVAKSNRGGGEQLLLIG